MNIINFIHQNKKYQIDFKLFKSHSKYFSLKKDINVKKEESFLLVDEFDYQCGLTEENINEFLLFFKSEDITLTNENIFQIKYLSGKYEVTKLIEEADKYINNNYRLLIDEFLNIHSQKEQLLSNQYQEELISYHMSEFLDDDRLPMLPINILYRIVSKFLNQIQINDYANKVNKVIDFLIKCTKRHGNMATNLFNLIELGNDEIEYLIEKVNKENGQIDISTNFLQKKIICFLCNKNKESKEEQIKMKKEFENKIERIQEEEHLQYKELQGMIKEMKNEMKKEIKYEINKMKEDYEQKIEEIKAEEFNKHQDIIKNIMKMKDEMKDFYDKQIEELQKIYEEQKEEINANETKSSILFHILNNTTNKRDNKAQESNDILKYIFEKNFQQKQINDIFNSIFIENKESNLYNFIFKFKGNLNSIESIEFDSKSLEILLSEDSFDDDKFISCINDFSKVSIELRTSTTNFNQILKNISTLKTKSQITKIDVTIIFDDKEIDFEPISKNKEIVDFIIFETQIKTIGEQYFKGFSSLKKISFDYPSPVFTLNKGCFSNCSSLSQITIPESITEIPDNAFEDCSSISEIIIPNTVTQIGCNAFKGCKSLINISIPQTVTFIGKKCFSGCSKLTQFLIPESIDKISDSALENCSSLKTIDFPSSVESIGIKAFSGCSSLTHIFIPETIKEICENAFEYCLSLKFIAIPSSFSPKFIGIQSNEKVEFYIDESDMLFKISRKFDEGDGVPINKNESFKYLMRSVDKRNAEALFKYGSMLYDGSGVPVDKINAAKYFKMSADKGQIDSMYEYGLMLTKGDGIPVDKREGARYIKMSADKGQADSMYEYGLMLTKGDGIPVDKREGARYIKMSADSNKIDAMIKYARMLKKGVDIVQNRREAANYFKKAADAGNLTAMSQYGCMLFNGNGIPIDKKEAINYLKVAAYRGHKRASYNYAIQLYNGQIIPMDKEKAAKFYKQAADKGHKSAMCSYAEMLNQGDGIPVNKAEAARYFQMAEETLPEENLSFI